ncbi:MAG: M1 family metallopeptidase [Planctomycetota bacterium]
MRRHPAPSAPRLRTANLGLLLLLVACATGADPTMPSSRRDDLPDRPPARAGEGVDLHSFARPDRVRVRHLALDLTLDFDATTVRGTCTLHLERRDPTAPLWLDTQDLQIDRVAETTSGRDLPWRLGSPDPQLGQPLCVALPPGCDRVTVRYATTPGKDAALQWLQPAQTAGALPFLFTQGQAILTRTWIPLQDSPAARVTWEAIVHAPPALRPLMSATERGGSAAAGWTFAMPHAVPSYLIALACGDLQEQAVSERCAVWAEPPVLPGAARELEDMERMVAACEQLFGPYRWGRYDVLILPASFPFGGMENPCLTFATPTILAGDKSLVALIAHELAHSWSGNLVTNATWRDFWLNEGFTVYLEQRIMEHVYGKERAHMEIALGMRDLAAELRNLPKPDQVLHIDLRGRNPDDGMTSVPYEKGAALLRRLEQVYGRARFDAFLRGWFDQHAFESVTTATFARYLHEHLLDGDPALAAQVDVATWLHQPGLPADAPVPESAAFAAVDAVKQAVEAGHSAAALQQDGGNVDWNTQQWLRFLDGLKADAALMAQIDVRYRLTDSGNSEILTKWLELAIAADYGAAMPRLEQFLLHVGRRKFLKPLYEALLRAPDGRDRALAIYRQARPRYHAVSVRTLDELLGWSEQ